MSKVRWDRQEWLPYFRHIADRMALKDWTIEITNDAPSSSTALANVHRIKGRRIARIGLSEGFLRDTQEEQRDTVVHELIHCHLVLADCLVGEKLSGSDLICYYDAQEYGVDALAATIASLMPLPSEVLDIVPTG